MQNWQSHHYTSIANTMGRKRKLHLGNVPIGGAPVKSRRLARTITSQYHVIQNERTLVQNNSALSAAERSKKLADLDVEMEKIGGTNRYQQASIISTQHFKTSKWVAGTLAKLNKQGTSNNKLNVLEVGAINTQLQQYNWMNVRSIDLNSQHPSFEECDFFSVVPEQSYDVVVCSMVLNCVDQVARRGEMLARLSCQLVPETGVLFLVLPRRCVHSPHVGGVALFASLLRGVGLSELVPMRETPKLFFFVLGSASASSSSSGIVQVKSSEKEGRGDIAVAVSGGEEESCAAGTTPAERPEKKSKRGAVSATKNNSSSKAYAPTSSDTAARVVGVGVSVSASVLLEGEAWKSVARAKIARHMTSDTFKLFSRDFSAVPANKFAIALPAELTEGIFDL